MSVTVAVAELPPVKLAGFNTSPDATAGPLCTVNEAVTVTPAVAEIITVVVAVTALVLTLKVAVVEPAATVTLAGTVAAAGLLLDRVTLVPPLGAAFVNVTVAVEELPPITVAGFNVSPDAAAEVEDVCTVNEAVMVAPAVAEIVTVVVAVTALVLTLKVAVVEPAATVTLVGTVAAAALLLDRVTLVPPLGAAFVSVTVAVEELPPITVTGLNVSPDAAAEVEDVCTVNEAVTLAPAVAEIVTVVVAATALVLTLKVAVVEPAATVTLAGTVAAAALLLDRVTLVPPLGAAFVSVTVAVEEAPPVKLVGLSAKLLALTAVTVREVLPVIPFKVALIVALPAL